MILFETSFGRNMTGHLKLEQTMAQHLDSLHLRPLHMTLEASSIKAKPSAHLMESQVGFLENLPGHQDMFTVEISVSR